MKQLDNGIKEGVLFLFENYSLFWLVEVDRGRSKQWNQIRRRVMSLSHNMNSISSSLSNMYKNWPDVRRLLSHDSPATTAYQGYETRQIKSETPLTPPPHPLVSHSPLSLSLLKASPKHTFFQYYSYSYSAFPFSPTPFCASSLFHSFSLLFHLPLSLQRVFYSTKNLAKYISY